MGSILVSAKIAGVRGGNVPDWEISLPPNAPDQGEPLTLRLLITQVVLRELEAFRQRQRANRLVRILTERQISDGLARGKVVPGGREFNQSVDDDAAVAAALQAFEDGLYLVILDGEDQRELDRQVWLRPGSRLTFVRLVMLAGA